MWQQRRKRTEGVGVHSGAGGNQDMLFHEMWRVRNSYGENSELNQQAQTRVSALLLFNFAITGVSL